MKIGDFIRVNTYDGREFEGTIISNDELVIKLSDGYNVGFSEDEISNITILEKNKRLEIDKSNNNFNLSYNDKLPPVLLLHTGGTIASKVDYSTGGTSNLFKPEEILSMYPEIFSVANVSCEFIANMSSDDFRFSHANVIASKITEVIKNKKYRGVVVTCGTDNMAFISCCTHYLLQGTPIPIVFTGSQRSSDRGSSDAATNLKAATLYAALGEPGVYVAMHETLSDNSIAIHHAPNVRKMHTSRRDAFKSINRPLVARIINNKIIYDKKHKSTKPFTPRLFKEVKIGVCLLHPNFFPEQLTVYESFDALILLGSGLGHAPINHVDEHTKIHEDIFNKIKNLSSKIPVIIGSHCFYGRVSLQVYSAGRKLQSLGVLGHGLAFTPEALMAKTALLLSYDLPINKLYDDFDDMINNSEVL